ncbi:MAG: dihydroxyacetone kinase subunit DhaL [Sphaerochaetaceae bacterium]|nr:dihydroxyacetone kinase subunit DhaL [Sphaerochaetaceae bacterium]
MKFNNKEYANNLALILSREFNDKMDLLCKLDGYLGDGDHGITIKRGMDAVLVNIENTPDFTSLSDVYKSIGISMLKTMGGASGPIFSTFFIQTSIELLEIKDNNEITAITVQEIYKKTLQALIDLSESNVGDKTMIDAVSQAYINLAKDIKNNNCQSVASAFKSAVDGAKAGALNTINMVAKKGRARYLSQQSIGIIDPGAVSFYIISCAMYKAWTLNSTQIKNSKVINMDFLSF